MPNVSFASGGDADTADYIAYVGKDPEEVGSRNRLECNVAFALFSDIGLDIFAQDCWELR